MKLKHNFHPSILRAYDIRGIVDKTINVNDAHYIGRAFGTYVVRAKSSRKQTPAFTECAVRVKICVGFDGRHSSPDFEAAIVEGLISTGADVIRVGRGPTPMLYYAVKYLMADAGIMITGSHNPPSHNGCKMMLDKLPLKDEEIQLLGSMAANGDFINGSGSVAFEEVFDEYVQSLSGAFKSGGKRLKIAWDAGNGASGEAMEELTKYIPGEHTILNEKIDGDFPAHHPDPSVIENMEQLKNAVLENGCDLGVAFDGDGDRVGVLDGQGRMIMGDQLMVLLARDVLAEHPGATVIADVKSSQVLFDEVQKAGGRPLMWKTGHSLIKYKMAELGAHLAGEVSGHIFYRANNCFDDGLYAALRLLNILSFSRENLAQMLDAIPKTFSTNEGRIDVPEERKFAVIEEIKNKLQEECREKKSPSPILSINDIDGLRVNTQQGWWLIRASNTQAALVSRCESSSLEGLRQLEASLKKYLEGAGVNLSL
jgi:phosphomannomutase